MNEKITLSDFNHYIGDVNLEYGGCFFDLSEWQYGYVPALRVTDLDSATGFDGAVMIERIIIIVDDDDQIDSALASYGKTREELPDDPTTRKLMIAEAVASYGYYDPDHGSHYYDDPSFPQSSHRMSHNNMIVIQCESDPEWGNMEYDNWKADVRLLEDDTLFDYLLREGYLSEFE